MTDRQRKALCNMLYILGGMLASILVRLYDESVEVYVLVTACAMATGVFGSMLKGRH